MLLLGNLISPSKAKEIGLINQIENDKLESKTMDIKIASKSAATVAIGKEAYKQLEMGLEDAYRYTSEVMTINMLKQDAQKELMLF